MVNRLDTYHTNKQGMAEAIELASGRIGYASAVVSPAPCIWRETWDDGVELATSARRFVLDHLAAATA